METEATKRCNSLNSQYNIRELERFVYELLSCRCKKESFSSISSILHEDHSEPQQQISLAYLCTTCACNDFQGTI